MGLTVVGTGDGGIFRENWEAQQGLNAFGMFVRTNFWEFLKVYVYLRC